MGIHGLIQCIFPVGTYHNGQTFAPCGMLMYLNGRYGSADTGMNRAADKSGRFPDLLSHLNGIAHLHDWVGRCTCVHGQRNHYNLRLRKSLKSKMLRIFLVLQGMYAAVIAGKPVLPDGRYIILNGFVIDPGEITHLYRLCQKLGKPSLFLKTLVDLLPCTVLVFIHFALAVLRTSALSV